MLKWLLIVLLILAVYYFFRKMSVKKEENQKFKKHNKMKRLCWSVRNVGLIFLVKRRLLAMENIIVLKNVWKLINRDLQC